MSIWVILEIFEEKLPNKEKSYISLTGKKNIDKECKHVVKVWNTFKTKIMKNYHEFYLIVIELLLLCCYLMSLKNLEITA